MKTLNDLEKKVWYRFLKVTYIGIFVFLQIFLLFFNYNFTTTQSSGFSLIPTVSVSNESMFDRYMNDPNISKDGKFKMLSDVQNGKLSEEDANGIISQIYGNTQANEGKISVEEFGVMIKNKYPDYKDIDNIVLGQKMLEKYPDYKDIVDLSLSNQTTTTEQPKEDKFNFLLFIFIQLILFIISYLIFFKLLNRIFYYIVLGKFNPEKK